MARGKACPKCGSRRTHVIGLWVTPEEIEVRRRHCYTCEHRWYGGQPPEELLPFGAVYYSQEYKNMVTLRDPELVKRLSYGG